MMSADINKRIKYFNSLIRRKRLSENELLKMPIGKNSVIEAKTHLSEKEKLELSRKYLAYYREERVKSLKIALVSVTITTLLIVAIVYSFMALI